MHHLYFDGIGSIGQIAQIHSIHALLQRQGGCTKLLFPVINFVLICIQVRRSLICADQSDCRLVGLGECVPENRVISVVRISSNIEIPGSLDSGIQGCQILVSKRYGINDLIHFSGVLQRIVLLKSRLIRRINIQHHTCGISHYGAIG